MKGFVDMTADEAEVNRPGHRQQHRCAEHGSRHAVAVGTKLDGDQGEREGSKGGVKADRVVRGDVEHGTSVGATAKKHVRIPYVRP